MSQSEEATMASNSNPSTSPSLVSDILMHPDILISIVRQITNLSDYIRFAGVCKSWRSAALLDRFATVRYQVPGFISYPRSGDCNVRRFIPIMHGGDRWAAQNRKNHRIRVKSSDLFDLSPFQGWLFLIGHNSSSLINPAIRTKFLLPSVDTLKNSSITRAAITSIPSAPATANARACYLLALHKSPIMSFIKVGDTDWRYIESGPETVFQDAIYFKGKFYLLTKNGNLSAIDEDQFDVASPVVHNVAHLDLPSTCEESASEDEGGNEESASENEDENGEELDPEGEDTEFSLQLVEIGGELMVLVRYPKRKKMFEIYKLDLSTNDWFRVEESFGDYALFIGYVERNFALPMTSALALPMASVSSSSKCILANNIYFTTCEVGKQFAYNFGDSAMRELCCPQHLSNTVWQIGFWFFPVPW